MYQIREYIDEFLPDKIKESSKFIQDLKNGRRNNVGTIYELNNNLESFTRNNKQILIASDRPSIQTSRFSLGFAELGYNVHILSRWSSERVDFINENIVNILR